MKNIDEMENFSENSERRISECKASTKEISESLEDGILKTVVKSSENSIELKENNTPSQRNNPRTLNLNNDILSTDDDKVFLNFVLFCFKIFFFIFF